MNTLTYVNENKSEIVQLFYGYSMSGVFARRLEDGRWDVCQVQYQDASVALAQDMWRVNAPELFHPLSGEKLIAVRGSNSFRAFIEASSPTEALVAFEAVVPRHYRSRPAPPAPALIRALADKE